jgi:hypothetical protein
MDLNLDKGRISGSNLWKGLAEFLNIAELREITFNSFSGTVNIQQGRARLDTALDSDVLRMTPKGVVGLDGILDLSLATALSPALLKKLDKRGKITSYLTDRDGWGQLPILLKGSVGQPKFGLDSAALIRQTETTVLNTLQQKLLKKTDDSPDNQTDDAKPADVQEQNQKKQSRKERKKEEREQRRKLLEDTLRGILVQ